MACWLTVTRLSTVTGAPAARCTAARLSRTGARADAGATGNGPDSGCRRAPPSAAPVAAATCSCPTTPAMASRPGTVTVATAVISRPWRITASPPPPERARTASAGSANGTSPEVIACCTSNTSSCGVICGPVLRAAAHAERRRADPDDDEGQRAPEHVTAPPAAAAAARAVTAYGPVPRDGPRRAGGAACARRGPGSPWSLPLRCGGTWHRARPGGHREQAPGDLRRRSRSRSASARSSCLSRRSACASTRQAPHAARWALARSSSAPLSSPSTRADSRSPRWLIVPAPADPCPGARGPRAAEHGPGGCGCARCRASRPWWPRSPRRRSPRCRRAPPPPGNPAAATAAPPGCPRRGGCRPTPAPASGSLPGIRWATSSPRPSNLIRCRRLAPSRKRLVVIRCSQPSKVPGV